MADIENTEMNNNVANEMEEVTAEVADQNDSSNVDEAKNAAAEEDKAPSSKDKDKKNKHYVNPIIAWTLIGLAAGIVLFVGLFVAATLR